MKVFIASSANEQIDKKYKDLARNVSNIFAKYGFDLMFGAANYSMMGECYREFVKYNRKIYAYTVPKYESDFEDLPEATCYKVDDTLIRFQKLYFNSDFIVILPGGMGTLAEFFSAIEEYRASLGNYKIILYNYEGYYDGIIDWMQQNVETGFFKEDFNLRYKMISDLETLEKIVNDFSLNYRIKEQFEEE